MGWLPEIGDVVLGKYRVVRALGQGGMGVVFEAVNVASEGRVALKMLKPTLEGGEERSSRMGREARASARLRSRFVARIFDFDFTPDGVPVLVMELLEGHDLSAEIRRHTTLGVDETLAYVIQACAGVAEAHALGIIHRDLKPGNLFLEEGTSLVRVLDFGLSKDLESETADLTKPTDALGTLTYMSPEQMRATKDIDARTDVWSLGVVLYRLLMGKLPIAEKSFAIATRLLDGKPLPRVDRRDVPRELAAVIACALEKDPARRYADARALGHALIPFLVHPDPATLLACEELGGAQAARTLSSEMLNDSEDTTARIEEPAIRLEQRRRSAPPLPPPRRKRRAPRPSWRKLTKETKMVLGAALLLALATLLIFVTNTATPSSAPAPIPSSFSPDPRLPR